MVRTILAACAVTGVAGPLHAQTLSGAELAERSMHRRAVEAVVWGMPAVNYERMLRAALANGAKANQVVYWSRPVNWKNQTLTPNPDTIYLNPFTTRPRGRWCWRSLPRRAMQ